MSAALVESIVADGEMLIAGTGTEEDRVEAIGRLFGMIIEASPENEQATQAAARVLGLTA